MVTDVVQKQGDPWSEVTIRETGERYWWNETTGGFSNNFNNFSNCNILFPRVSGQIVIGYIVALQARPLRLESHIRLQSAACSRSTCSSRRRSHSSRRARAWASAGWWPWVSL